MGALAQSGYMFPLIFGTELIVGLLLLTNRFVPLALIFLAPLTIHIIAFHLAMDLAGIGPGVVVALLQLYLLFAYLPSFAPLLRFKSKPVSVHPSTNIEV